MVYLLFPRDLVPDFLGRGLGLVDDLALIVGMVWYYRRQLRDVAARSPGAAQDRNGRREEEGRRKEREQGRGSRRGPTTPPPRDRAPDPYAILGVPRSASQEEIRSAYRARMREYHPDKVSHLGEELQQLAHRKAQQIQRAFETLRK